MKTPAKSHRKAHIHGFEELAVWVADWQLHNLSLWIELQCLRFALAAMAVIGAGIWLSFIGDEISKTTGWGTSFVGSLFLAIATSMPELVVTVAAVRFGAADMAVADILGANMLDIVAIIWTDLFYTQGPILASASNSHLITVVVTVAMSLLVITGLQFRQNGLGEPVLKRLRHLMFRFVGACDVQRSDGSRPLSPGKIPQGAVHRVCLNFSSN